MEPNPYEAPKETRPTPGRYKLPALSTGTWFAVAVAGFALLIVVLDFVSYAMRDFFP
jgi:hypothetical protein